MKKILVLNYEFPPLGGGASPVSYELAKRLSESGEYDIDVVTMHYKGLKKYEEINKNMRVYRIRALRKKKELCQPYEQLTYLISGFFKARKLIKKNKYDICHTHFIIPTGALAYILKKIYKLDYVITAHGSDVLGYNQRFAKLYPYLIKPWKAIIDNSKLVISPSNFLKQKIYNVYPELDKSKVIKISNGIDTNKFTPQKKTKTIFASGRLFANKGFQYLIKAMSDEDLGWEVHIAGDGPMMDELQKLAKKSKTKVILHGWLNNNEQEYKNLLEQASIFVLPSEFENAPNVVLEAMSAGCAVITTKNTGGAEMIENKDVLCEFGNIEQLRNAIKNLIGQDELLNNEQEKNTKRAKEQFNWQVVADKYKEHIS